MCYMQVKFLLLSAFSFFYLGTLLSQCFTIESILVDACGSPEGPNEMVRIKVGQNPLIVNDLNITWPNNAFLGFCQNATTAQKVADLNATVLSCGIFLEPLNGILPANELVLIITSVDFDPTAHNYAGLEDTMYVLFQCAGNTNGHFANWLNGCDPATGDRTLTMNYGALCLESVTYNRCFLLNQTGGIGGTAAQRDGARADFDADGNVSYANDGCVLPQQLLAVEILNTPSPILACVGSTVTLVGEILGNYAFFQWTASGQLLNASQLNGFNYTITETTDHTVYLSAFNACGDSVTDSILVQVLPSSLEYTIEVNDSQPFCLPGDAVVQISSNATFIWQDGSTANPYFPNESGWFVVAFQNSCGIALDSVFIEYTLPPSCSISSVNSNLCSGDSLLLEASSTNSDSWGWQSLNNTSYQFMVSQGGEYFFSASNVCGVCEVSVIVEETNVQAFFTANPNQGTVPLEVDIQNGSSGGTSAEWTLDGAAIYLPPTNSIELTSSGSFTLTLTVEDSISGCSDTWSELLIATLDVSFVIPNVFTPNNDGSNDVFTVESSLQGTLNYTILNRWGNVMISEVVYLDANVPKILWNGYDESSGDPASTGVYFYQFQFESIVSETQTMHGFFHLFR